MKNTSTARPRTLALLLAATVFPATPVLAQEAAAPPPVTATTPQPEAPAAPPVAATPAPAQAPVFAPRAEVVQPLPARPAPAPEAEASEPAPRATVTRTARPAPRARAAAPVAEAPAAAPVAVTPAPVPVPEVAPEPVAPVASTSPEQTPVTADATETSTTTTTQTPWMWIVGGLIALGAIVALLFTRRRRPVDEVGYNEPVYVAPAVASTPVIEPIAAAPVYTPPVYTPPVVPTATTPVADDERPWIGLSLQAMGSNDRGDSDLVEYNLIVENAGEVMASDVRVSTFLIDGTTKSSEAETSLIDAVGETQSRFIDLAPGTSVPIASTLTVPHGVDPCIIAEAHYPLPGGGEGHIAARFVIENGKGDMVEARLDDVLERV